MKLRYYGLLAAASKKKLAKLRKMLYVDSIPANEQENDQQFPKVLLCPICGSPLQWVEKLQKGLHRAVSKGFKDHVLKKR